MTTEYQYIQSEQRGAALWVTLNRPEVRNAFNAGIVTELRAAFEGVSAGGAARAVVLAGAGASFCAGADVGLMRAMAAYSHEQNVADATGLALLLEDVEGCAVPVIARVQGAALGGGVGLVAACDIVIAAEGALFGFTEARLGIAPAVIAPFVLRKIGPGYARALFLTGERFDAARAAHIGLVHRVVPPDGLDAAVEETVAAVAACGPEALRACKKLVESVPGLSREEARRFTAEMNATLRAGEEGQEGLRAFLEKRTPCFVKS